MAIEVLSTFTAKKDLNEKFNLYEEVGVKEYWVVFPEARVVNVFLLKDEKYALAGEYDENAQVPVATLPSLVVDLTDIFTHT